MDMGTSSSTPKPKGDSDSSVSPLALPEARSLPGPASPAGTAPNAAPSDAKPLAGLEPSMNSADAGAAERKSSLYFLVEQH